VDLPYPADAPTVGGAHPVPDRRQVDRAVRDEPLAVGELGQSRLADHDLGARALEPPAHGLPEAKARGRRDRLDRVCAVGPHGRSREQWKLTLVSARTESGNSAPWSTTSVDALARRVEDAREIDDVAELEPRERGVGDRRRQVDLVHPDVVEPADRWRWGHSIPSRGSSR